MNDCEFDVVVAGSGPVGLATAIHARQLGMTAVVFDRRSSPAEKACGEGIMPRGRAELDSMGVRLPYGAAAPFVGIQFIDGAFVAEARFASGPGLGVRRTVLWQALAERAAALGVEMAFDAAVRCWRCSKDGVDVLAGQRRVRGRLLVGADGLRSRVRELAGLQKAPGSRRRYGMRRHFEVAPWSSFVEVHWDDQCEAYVTPVGPSCVGVALLWRGGSQRFDELLRRFPALIARLEKAQPLDAVRGAGPFDQRVRSRVAPGVALVGDAAGYVDPLTGEGLTLGFESARLLVEGLARGDDAAEYDRTYRRISRMHVHSTRLLLAIGARPALRRRVVRGLARTPDLFSKLLAITARDCGFSELRVGDLARALGVVLP